MGLEDLVNKAKEAVAGIGEQGSNVAERAKSLLNSDQAEGVTDQALDGVANVVNKVTGDKFADQVSQAKEMLDGKLGNE